MTEELNPKIVHAYECPIKDCGFLTKDPREAVEHVQKPVFRLPNGLVYKFGHGKVNDYQLKDSLFMLFGGKFHQTHNTSHQAFRFTYGDYDIKGPGQLIQVPHPQGDQGIIEEFYGNLDRDKETIRDPRILTEEEFAKFMSEHAGLERALKASRFTHERGFCGFVNISEKELREMSKNSPVIKSVENLAS